MSSSSNQIKHTSDLAHHLLSVQCGCSICPHYRRYENIRCSTKSKQDKLCFIASQQTVMCSELQVNVYIIYVQIYNPLASAHISIVTQQKHIYFCNMSAKLGDWSEIRDHTPLVADYVQIQYCFYLIAKAVRCVYNSHL